MDFGITGRIVENFGADQYDVAGRMVAVKIASYYDNNSDQERPKFSSDTPTALFNIA
jgi:hypothetical protein